MRILTPGIHRVLDFVTVAVFALAPTVLGLTGVPAILAYALAGVHLLMTVITDFRGGDGPPLPLGIHGAVEAIVGPVLLALPWVLGWEGMARIFYLAMGGVIVVVWGLSRYGNGETPEASL